MLTISELKEAGIAGVQGSATELTEHPIGALGAGVFVWACIGYTLYRASRGICKLVGKFRR